MSDRTSVQIAEVVSDLRAGRAIHSCLTGQAFDEYWTKVQVPGPVIDATQIFRSAADNPKPVYIYEDHPNIAPPWPSAFICYVNDHGNVVMIHISSVEVEKKKRIERWNTENSVDWTKVRWLMGITVWAGGYSKECGELPVMGPLHGWRHAVYENGEPADITWLKFLPERPLEEWDAAQLVLLGALNYMNCRNVDIVEPSRPRAEARRIARTGVRVSVINVFPVGKSTRSESKNNDCGVPLTSVRGHFNCYGPDYGKGLLFGKLAGRFWIPQHARGDKAHGEVKHDYVLKPQESSPLT